MPVTSVSKDPETLTMTVVADFEVPVRRLWDAYLDPRQLERFWGPPDHPAVFTRHDGYPGGRSEYTMAGPDGTPTDFAWEWVAVDEPSGFEVRDGDGIPGTGPARMVFAFEATATGSRVTGTSYFDSVDDLQQMVDLGMEQGMTEAMGQIDTVLADLASFAAEAGTNPQLLDDRRVRVSRVIRGDMDAVWRAHHEPALLQRWMLGPDGWTMPVCEVATEVGQTYRYEWQEIDGDRHFGFTGTLLESAPPHRSVTTESMIGVDAPAATNELTLTPVEGGTLLAVVMTFTDSTVRDAVLATGMTDGMEASYARLESVLDGSVLTG
ncbi:SRPBCC family protein [Jatrophihabitans endophyticus]|uniref:SRPBCC family protein n=1 Tax=Jatrophihabitans endophyticus TaxID=1206085 RepID=UPI0019DB9A3F|nr:SRPBCC family protein [Jatrophihabitans endophyticus]MBE7187767.1 SRPBCC domain-containing protein [Jatrophihabitans endophyticus]